MEVQESFEDPAAARDGQMKKDVHALFRRRFFAKVRESAFANLALL